MAGGRPRSTMPDAKRRVAYFAHTGEIGGPNNSLMELLHGLDRARFEPFVYFRSPGGCVVERDTGRRAAREMFDPDVVPLDSIQPDGQHGAVRRELPSVVSGELCDAERPPGIHDRLLSGPIDPDQLELLKLVLAALLHQERSGGRDREVGPSARGRHAVSDDHGGAFDAE